MWFPKEDRLPLLCEVQLWSGQVQLKNLDLDVPQPSLSSLDSLLRSLETPQKTHIWLILLA